MLANFDKQVFYTKALELQKENEELEENYKVLENEYITNSIPKSVIQDKIEELEDVKLCSDKFYELIIEDKIKLLKELLNKGE